MQYELKLPRRGKTKHPIPDDERLVAAARCFVDDEDPNEVAKELFEQHGLKAPKHGAQVFASFMRKICRLVREGDEATIAKCKELGFDLVLKGGEAQDEQ